MEKRKRKTEKIQESIIHIKENYEEPGMIILNPKTYKKVWEENVLNFGPEYNYNQIFGIPIIVENIKEDCLVLPKSTLEIIKEKLNR